MQRMTPPRGMVPLGPQVTEHVSVKVFVDIMQAFFMVYLICF